jgi:hypothetical protein
MDAGVLDDLRCDRAFLGLSRFGLGIPPGVQAAVAVHGGVPQELAHQRAELVRLKQLFKLVVDDIGDQTSIFIVRAGQLGGLHFQPVGRDSRDREQHDALEEIEHGRRQAVGLDPFPLLADEEVLVGFDRVVQPELRIIDERLLVLLPDRPVGRLVFPHHCFSSLSVFRASRP